MQQINLDAITIDKVSDPVFIEKKLDVEMLRLDNIHPIISGNKWFKLRYYLDEARQLNKRRIVTAGGAWSNHLMATAAACKLNGWESVGLVRGEEPPSLTPVLRQAAGMDMKIIFTGWSDSYHEEAPEEWKREENYFIPRGGYGEKGAAGAATILDHCQKENYSHICCAVGTGTMIAGLEKRRLPSQQLTGISVLRNNTGITEDIKRLCIAENTLPTVLDDYHFGGYAKHTPELLQFMNDFYTQNSIPTDFVYTGKLCFAIRDLCLNDFFEKGARVLIIHSGGLGGNISLKKGTLIF